MNLNLQTLTLSFSILIIAFVLIEYVIWKSALKSLEKGEYKKAIKIYKLYPFKTEEDLFNIGFCHSKNKQHQKALKYYNKTLKTTQNSQKHGTTKETP